MPTFLFMRKGEVVDQFSGASTTVLRQKIEGLLLDSERTAGAADARGPEEKTE